MNIQKLPIVFQTVPQQEFFAATVDQLFAKKNVEQLDGFVGQRSGAYFQPLRDSYVGEATKNQAAYQLEPAAVFGNNSVFYAQLLDYLSTLNTPTGNHDRLFSTPYYSYCPPIDVDKFVNYSSYQWVSDALPPVIIEGFDDAAVQQQILGQPQFTISNWLTNFDLTLTSGLVVTFPDSTQYQGYFHVEGVGRSIDLVPVVVHFEPGLGNLTTAVGQDYAANDVIVLSNGTRVRVLQVDGIGGVSVFDILPHLPNQLNGNAVPVNSVQTQATTTGIGTGFELLAGGTLVYSLVQREYVVIERNLRDTTAWNTTNRWYHQDVVSLSNQARQAWAQSQNSPQSFVQISGQRAMRPIIEYVRYLELFTGAGSVIKVPQSKSALPQWPRFQLYDGDGVPLNASQLGQKYQGSNFTGNVLFGYKVAGRDIDSELGWPVIKRNLGQLNDIVFENAIQQPVTYQVPGGGRESIKGYYFYKQFTTNDPSNTQHTFGTNWNPSQQPWLQRVIDRYLVEPQQTTFDLTAPPTMVNSQPEIRVQVNGQQLGIDQFSYDALTQKVTVQAPEGAVVEIATHTANNVSEVQDGYFDVPIAIKGNVQFDDLQEATWNDLSRHMISIIQNQPDFVGSGFGGSNNYRDSAKQLWRGELMVQTVGNLLKTMLTVSNQQLDIAQAIDFSALEYARYKNKLVGILQQMINENFVAFDAGAQTTAAWLDHALQRMVKSREFDKGFDDTYMLPWSNLYVEEQRPTLNTATYELTQFVDLTNRTNSILVYLGDQLLTQGGHYDIVNLNPITVVLRTLPPLNTTLTFRLFESATPAFLPATPAALGLVAPTLPKIETINTTLSPVTVLVGHDNSQTPLFGNIIDNVLLEFESRIFSNIPSVFKENYEPPIISPLVRPGFDRNTRWTRDEWLDLVRARFVRWATYHRVDWRTNETFVESDAWSWNYQGLIINYQGRDYVLSGSWQAVFLDLYDTITPHLTPWQMLGFDQQPQWWTQEYGTDFSSLNTAMWNDIENGQIRQGPRAGIDSRFVRPGLQATRLPVTATGTLFDTPLQCIGWSGTLPVTFDPGRDWSFGQLGTVEQIWARSEWYDYHIALALFLAVPGLWGELYWDPAQTTTLAVDPRHVVNVTSLTRQSTRDLVVHGEVTAQGIQINSGYQVWISNKLKSQNLDVTQTFGDALRAATTKLGYLVAGFATDLEVFASSAGTAGQTTSLVVPPEDITLQLQTSPPIKNYVYSGVLVRSVGNGTYQVFGYDAQNERFLYVPRLANPRDQTITVGGQNEPWRVWAPNQTFVRGSIVNLNGTFYESLIDQSTATFVVTQWTKLSSLPSRGGAQAVIRTKGQDQVAVIDYGHVFDNAQAVVDFLLGYGEWLESQGFVFDQVIPETGQAQTWLEAAKSFLFWSIANWAQDESIALSPAATQLKVQTARGYLSSLDRSQAVVDQNGINFESNSRKVSRSGSQTTVESLLDTVGVYGMRAQSRETQSALFVENRTRFGDLIFDSVLGIRQPRLRIRGSRTTPWSGLLEAPGYLVIDNQLVPNFENLVDGVRNYYSTETSSDLPLTQTVAKHLTNFVPNTGLTELGLDNNSQFLFYQRLLSIKGTLSSLQSLRLKNQQAQLTAREEWALRVGSFGSLCAQQKIELLVPARDFRSDSQMIELDYFGSQFDAAPDSVVVDFDDPKQWLTKPTPASCARPDQLWPVWQGQSNIPNGGYVHLDDVDYSIFEIDQLFDLWQTPTPPTSQSLIHVARAPDWAVFGWTNSLDEVAAQSIQGTKVFEPNFGSTLNARVAVLVNSDGELRSLSDPTDPLPIDITGDIVDVGGAGQIAQANFLVALGDGQGATLETTVDANDVVDTVQLKRPGAGYGTPTRYVVDLPEPVGLSTPLGATLRAQVNNQGQIASVEVIQLGRRYSPGLRAVTVPRAGGAGTGTNATVSLAVDMGRLIAPPPFATPLGSGYALEFSQTLEPQDGAPVPTGSVEPQITLAVGAVQPAQLRGIVTTVVFGPDGGVYSAISSIEIADGGFGYRADDGTGTGVRTINSLFDANGVEINTFKGAANIKLLVENFRIVGALLPQYESLVIFGFGDLLSGFEPFVTFPTNGVLIDSGVFQPTATTIEIDFLSLVPGGLNPQPTAVGDVVIVDGGFGFTDGVYPSQTDQFGGEWTVTVAGGQVTALVNTLPGAWPSGAVNLTNLTAGITGVSGVLTSILATVNSFGQISAVTLVSGGSGYASGGIAPLTFNGGTGAQIQFTVSSAGTITGVTLLSGGVGYSNTRTIEWQDSTPPGTRRPIRIGLNIDRFGKLSGAVLIDGGVGNYFEVGQTQQTVAAPQNSGNGANGQIAYGVDASGSLIPASLQISNPGQSYLVPTVRTVEIVSDTVLSRNFEFEFNGQPVVFRVQNVSDVVGIVEAINQAELAGITCQVFDTNKILLRSVFDKTINIVAASAVDQSLWISQVGVDWFGAVEVESVLRGSATVNIRLSDNTTQQLNLLASSTAVDITQAINDLEIFGLTATVSSSGALVVNSKFNPNIELVSADLAWARDIDILISQLAPLRSLGQISSAMQIPGVEPLPGLVAFNNPLPVDQRLVEGFVLLNNQLYTSQFVSSVRVVDGNGQQTLWLYQLFDQNNKPIPNNTFENWPAQQLLEPFVLANLRFANQADVEVLFADVRGQLILNQTQANFNGVGDNGAFEAGVDYTVSDTLTLSNGAQITVTAISDIKGLIVGQTQVDFDSSVDNGTFVGGSGYQATDQIELSNGAVLVVNNVDGTGGVTEFEILLRGDEGLYQSSDQFEQDSSTGIGTGFELVVDSNNLQPRGDIVGFEVSDAGNQPVSRNSVLAQDSTSGSGQGFELVPNRRNLRLEDQGDQLREINQAYLRLISTFDTQSPIYWADQSATGGWQVRKFSSEQASFVPHRQQQPLVDTTNVLNAFVYDQQTGQTLLQVPTYDPFKGLIAGPAAQNITYFTSTDPARYNSPTALGLLRSDNPPLGENNVGQVWWDLSKVAYYWYEQGTNTYRRNNWGKLVPGSTVDVYEWTRCNQPPSQYRGLGQVKNVDEYVIKQELDSVLLTPRTVYYFWVKNQPQQPTTSCVTASRTLSTTAITKLLEDPRAQQYRWFSPISQSALVINGIDRTFTDSDNIVQINYRIPTLNPVHTEWELARENDLSYAPNLRLWQKMANSIAEWVGPVSSTVDLTQAGFAGWQPDVNNPTQVWLPVPAPNLSDTQRYGVAIRPRQTMFKQAHLARGILAQKLNEILAPLRLRDEQGGWSTGFNTGTLWQWADWWADGRNAINTVPTRRVTQLATLEALSNLFDGEVILVTGIRNSLYQYNLAQNSFDIVYRQAARVQVDQDQLQSQNWSLAQAQNLLELLDALDQRVFQNSRRVMKNQVFFALLNYAFTEQPNVNWAFKTTYINVKQPQRLLEQSPILEPNQTNVLRQHLEEYKPYHTKIRTLTDSVATPRDQLDATAQELVFDQTVTMRFDRVRCGLSLPELRAIRSANKFDGVRTLIDQRVFVGDNTQNQFVLPPTFQNPTVVLDGVELLPGINYNVQLPAVANPNGVVLLDVFSAPGVGAVLQVNQNISIATGAAGRYAASLVHLMQDILFVPSALWSDYTQAQPSIQDELKEIKAASKINRAIRIKLRCDFRGVTFDANGLKNTIPWDYTQWDETPWDGSLDILASQFDAANTELANSFQEQSVSETVADGVSSTFPIPSGVLPDLIEVRVDGAVVFRNMDYFVIGGQIWFVDAPAANSVIELYTVMDAGPLLNPQVQANITDEMIPLRITEALVLTVTEL